MQRGGTTAVAVNGGEIAPLNSDKNSVSLLDLRLVLPLRKTTPGVAENRRLTTAARRRMRSGDFAVFVQRANETGAPRKTERVIVSHIQ